jgi:hypothetical protein
MLGSGTKGVIHDLRQPTDSKPIRLQRLRDRIALRLQDWPDRTARDGALVLRDC